MYVRAQQAFLARERAQLRSDLLELSACVLPAKLRELRSPRLVVGKELARECTAADLVEQGAHRRLDAFVHDARAAGEVAVLRDVGDGIAHVLEAAFIDQVDDELQ